MLAGIDVVAARDLVVHAGDARRRVAQAVALGVFSDRDQQLAHRGLGAFPIDWHTENLVSDYAVAGLGRRSAPGAGAPAGRCLAPATGSEIGEPGFGPDFFLVA